MGKTKKKSNKAGTYRSIIQFFFLVFSIFFLVTFEPSKEFMLTTLSLLLIITLLFRSGFCGWICPIGAIVDFVRWVGKTIGGLSFIKPINKKYKKWVKNNKGILTKIDKYARYFRYVFLLWILQAAFLSIASIKDGDEHGILTVIYLVIALLVLGLFVDRAWCKYACPLGAIIGIFGKLGPTRVTRIEEACINCKLCSKNCPMSLDVANMKAVNKLDCNTCLTCVDVCPVEGALDLKMNLPFINKEKSKKIEATEKQVVE